MLAEPTRLLTVFWAAIWLVPCLAVIRWRLRDGIWRDSHMGGSA